MDAAERAQKCAEELVGIAPEECAAYEAKYASVIQRHLEEHAVEATELAEKGIEAAGVVYRKWEEARALADRLAGHVARLLGDLTDAERAIEGWKFKGGMGANIATEDRGRFPTILSRKHREDAEAALAAHAEARK